MDAFSVRTKIMIGGGMDALAQRLHRVFLVTDKFKIGRASCRERV